MLSDPNSSPLVQVKEVYKQFPVGDSHVTVLKGISFTVQSGEFVSIVGPSGNGKSTLLNMITGIDHPTQGAVYVTGEAVHTMSENQLAVWRGEHVGIIFQFFQLLPALSLLKNIILPMDLVQKLPAKQRRVRALELLDSVGLADQAHKLPSMVSGGQQQRAAIARALANRPVLVLADEPTGALDTQTSVDIMHLLQRLNRDGITIILVTHEPDIAKFARRILQFRDGRIINAATLSDPAQPGAAGFSDLPKGESP